MRNLTNIYIIGFVVTAWLFHDDPGFKDARTLSTSAIWPLVVWCQIDLEACEARR